MTKQLKIDIGHYSSAGIKAENQDSVNYCIPTGSTLESKGIVSVLADGVSSSEAAKQASDTAVKSFIHDFYSTPETWSTKKSCQQVISAINSWLYKQGSTHATELRGWVTTFDAVIFKSTTAYLVHVGDSRIYRLRDGDLSLLSKDHTTWINSDRSYLSRALGIDSILQIDFKQLELQPGDIFLQTSDGVHDFISDAEISAILGSTHTAQDKSQRLVERAIANQSDDNLSAQVSEVIQLPSATKQEVYEKLSELPFPPELQPGMKIDGYEILQELSLSPRSQIYLARDMENDQELVLKTPSSNYSDDPWYLDGFVREEWIGQRLTHPGLMKTYKSHKSKQFLYFTTEYIKGQTLRQWISENPTPDISTVRDLISQLSSALRAMHRQDVIHQDLKPENIMITPEGRIKIIDFGAVHAAGLAELASVLQRQHPEGTLNYTAPEYLMGEPGSKRSDIFSLGVICYEMFCGALPYEEKKVNKFQLKSYQHMRYIPIQKRRKELPLWLDQVLKTACAANPVKRYSLLSEFIHQLKTPQDVKVQQDFEPLLQKNPVLVWQLISLSLLLTLIASFYFR
ncbi:bifunctional protein-serine/threonine kinase/phosphatase [Thiomicrorhabdus sediminis]|uniref:Bifunctional protein-serine/threonine kinase/phosphatase n=1 Tax=Thiomicrorhabdus sediminis TaxID=2580412 RepID=A0A4P9K7M0_9GAMM|nr:bifunctional protein-serine/threonine kinase/phosphatase [Thiomicrorhabdus sediminis]QCU90237.1 bifunctional protein-serine/threonine kinase/phosphatase [Thiomicrorhabdus sediminis]